MIDIVVLCYQIRLTRNLYYWKNSTSKEKS